jgi:uncharacterized protein YwgA
MMEEILVPLLLTSVLTAVQGRTRFQKLVFLVQKKAEAKKISSSKYRFELYHYGPFSADLSTQLDRLVSMGYLMMIPETTPGGYTRYQYRLTSSGEAFMEEMKAKQMIPAELRKTIVSVSDRYGTMPLPRLVKIAYGNL